MKEMRRALAALLVLVMVVGMIPVTAFAADSATDYLFMATDRHENTEVIGNLLTQMENTVGDGAIDYVGLGGDMVNDTNSYNTSTILAEVTGVASNLSSDTVDIVYAASHDKNNTDDAGIMNETSGCMYETDYAYIYGVVETDVKTASSASTAAADFVAWATNQDGDDEDIDTSKVILVLSHFPIHAKRGDNAGAGYWHNALNEVATGSASIDTAPEVIRDIVFFHGHNHTVDSGEYFYKVGDTMSVASYVTPTSTSSVITTYISGVSLASTYAAPGNSSSSSSSGTNAVIGYTYVTAGYLNKNKQATLVTITENSIVLDKYTTSGSSTLGSVTRVVTETEPVVTGIAVDGQETYTVGDAFVTPTVYAHYDNGSDVDLDADAYTVTGTYDMNTAGTYTLTYTYGEFTAEYTFTVEAADPGWDLLSLQASGTTVYTVGDELTFSQITVSYRVDGDSTIYYYYPELSECKVTGTYDMNTAGDYQVTVSWSDADETISSTYWFTVCDARTDTQEGVTVSVAEAVIPSGSITVNEDSHQIDGAIDYVAYDITPASALNAGNYATITFPVPEGYGEGVNVARVYCVDTEEWFEDLDDDASTITIRTSHFSTWAVVDINGETDTGSVEYSSTTGGTETKTVYVLTDTITNGNNYLIVDINAAGSGNALTNNSTEVDNTAVTVQSGSLTIDGTTATKIYIDLEDSATGAVWTAGTSSSSYTFENDDSYLYHSSSTLYIGDNTSKNNWTLGDGSLHYTGGGTTYYLTCSDSAWTLTSSAANVYIYKETEATIDTTVTVSGTLSLQAEAPENVVVEEGQTNTATITTTAVVTGEDGTVTTVAIPSDATYTYSEISDPNGILAGGTVTDGAFTLNAVEGTAKIRVYVAWDMDGNGTVEENEKIWDTVTVTTTVPYYTIDITDGKAPVYTQVDIDAFADGVTYYTYDSDSKTYTAADAYVEGTTYYTLSYASVTETIALKSCTFHVTDSEGNVTTQGTTYQLHTLLTYTGVNTVDTTVDVDGVTWSSSNTAVATVDENGLVTVIGGGQTTITVTYTLNGTTYTDKINLTATASEWYTSADSGKNLPEFPEPGSVRFDKTATAVGAFSQTGIAQVELSMTGKNYGTAALTDVVIMVDMTTSMETNDITAAKLAVKELIKTLVYDETTDTYDTNYQIFVRTFKSGSYTASSGATTVEITNYLDGVTISNYEELEAAYTEIDGFNDTSNYTGTCYNVALADVYATLTREDAADNQFVVFVTDGVPTTYAYLDTDSDSGFSITTGSNSDSGLMNGWFNTDSTDSVADGTVTDAFLTEYWTYKIKSMGVSVYTVGANLTAGSNAAYLIDHMSSNYSADGKTSTGYTKYSFTCTTSGGITDEVLEIFQGIANSIKEAATKVTVTDKIADDYTLILEIPSGVDSDNLPEGQEFYIEVLEYALDSKNERTTSTSLIKLYLGTNEDGSYYAASDASGTAFAAPVFEEKTSTQLGYWSITETDTGISYTTTDGTVYYFVADGSGTHNITSGAVITGTSSENMIIFCKYFAYNAATRMLVWSAEKLTESELALSYFLYLDGSAGSIGTSAEVEAGPYETNDYAYITYTNHLGNKVYQEFPVPQMTWNGAQVTYVFYLVDENGDPVNKAGQTVDFANATFITAPVTESVIWNGTAGVTSLESSILASGVLPEGYVLYDAAAEYDIRVFQDSDGSSLFDYFTIAGGTEDEIAAHLNESLGLTLTTGATDTTKVYNTKAGNKYSEYGTYSTIAAGTYSYTHPTTKETINVTVDTQATGIDYSNTTVAFAVTWVPSMVKDVVVVDYGLTVEIQPLLNDGVKASLNSVSEAAYESQYAINKGIADEGFEQVSSLTLSNGDVVVPYGSAIYYVQKDMTFNEPATFYYDAEVTYYKESVEKTGYMYSSVTVIPATTIYYEDSFVTLTTQSKSTADDGTVTWSTDETSGWITDGTTLTGKDALQDTDRPGVGSLDDANNLYGSDSHYTNMSQYSLGSAQMVTVSADRYATAEFEFYGTGFDVISLTSNTTGTIMVDVFKATDGGYSETAAKSFVVDTYYGYTYDTETETWVAVDTQDPSALYQVPVMKVEGLSYGQYKVRITAVYAELFDHQEDDSYDFYLDAIRIYDPAGNEASGLENTTGNAYVADNELYPNYYQLRDWIITADTFDVLPTLTPVYDTDGTTVIHYVDEEGNVYQTASVAGIVFIDGKGATASIKDYTAYGPNNELYLTSGQSISFNLNATAPEGYKVDTVQIALKSVGGTAYSKIWDAAASNVEATTAKTISTATDMYYNITALNGKTVVIMNAGETDDAIVSITNIKVTYEADASATALSTASMFTVDVEGTELALMSLNPVEEEADTEDTTETTTPETQPEEDTETDDSSDDAESVVEKVVSILNKVSATIKSWFQNWLNQ